MKSIKKKIISFLAFVLIISSTSVLSINNEKVSAQESNTFHLSTRLSDGANNSVGWYWQNNDGIMAYALYRALTISNPSTGEIEPDLAEEFSVSEDGLVHTYVLKDNLMWSDGQPLTAEDVKFSIETSLKVSLINGIFPDNFNKIEGASEFVGDNADEISGIAIDNNTIEITLEEPVGMFSEVVAQFVIFPKHALENEDPLELHNSNHWQNPVTSGMYQVKEINAGNFIELEKSPNYEGEEPKIDNIIVSFINDPVLAMRDGQTFYHSTNRLEEISQFDSIEGVVQYPIDILFYRYFIVNLEGHGGNGDALLADPVVREALMYGIDRQILVDSVMQGTANVLNSGVPIALEEYNDELNTYEYNPELARQMLEEAGYDFSRPLKLLYYYTDQNSIDFMQAISYQLSELGIENELTLAQSDATTALFQTRDYDLGYKGLSSFGYESWYGEYASSNTNFSNIYGGDESFDELVNELSRTINEDERESILQDLQTLEQEKLFKLPLFTTQNFVYLNESKVSVPEDFEFGNPFYRFDFRFDEWEIK